MALNQSALLELSEALHSADGNDLMRRLLLTILQELVDAQATARIGAAPHERTDTRTAQRNRTRDKTVSTTCGDLTVKIPKLRTGSFFPFAAGAAPADHPGVARGGDAGLRRGREHPQGR